MTPENTAALIAIYPPLFQHGCFCFECGDGWFGLLKECVSSIAEVCKRENLDGVFVDQVKEKFGALRFYVSAETEEISKIIDDAERESVLTCEACGEPGRLRSVSAWYSTWCDMHMSQWTNRKNDARMPRLGLPRD
jgi:hypothetical protein